MAVLACMDLPAQPPAASRISPASPQAAHFQILPTGAMSGPYRAGHGPAYSDFCQCRTLQHRESCCVSAGHETVWTGKALPGVARIAHIAVGRFHVVCV